MRMSPRTALVHDWLTGMRGGERVLESLCGMYPDADVFTLFYQPERIGAGECAPGRVGNRIHDAGWSAIYMDVDAGGAVRVVDWCVHGAGGGDDEDGSSGCA